jgi:photosystem II stability/assembly factor-like uncharacterized protein
MRTRTLRLPTSHRWAGATLAGSGLRRARSAPSGIRRAVVVAVTLLLMAGIAPASAQRPQHPQNLAWHALTSPGAGTLRGLAVGDHRHGWVGSDEGGLWRTADGGRSWQDVAPPNSDGLVFRHVVALSARRAVVLAIGGIDAPDGEEPARAAHIYQTGDGGRTWHLAFVNTDPAAFYSCFDMFQDQRHGLAVSDPVGGRFQFLATDDGGRSWHVQRQVRMPAALTDEGAIDTGECLQTTGDHNVWLGTGFAAQARIFHSSDRGRTWTVTSSRLTPRDPSGGGVFALDFKGQHSGLGIGGSFDDPTNMLSAFSRTGHRWHSGEALPGLRYSVAWLPSTRRSAVAVGPTGSDVTRDGGQSWRTFSPTGFEEVMCAPDGTCWASDEHGGVARLSLGSYR